VALARKLLIALWRYVEQGEIPDGAHEMGWEVKLKRVLARRADRRGEGPESPVPSPRTPRPLPSSLCSTGGKP
jgi:hypothetical protein